LIYLDYNATTPVDSEVADAMWPYINAHFGNPSSSHELGQYSKKAIEKARDQIKEAFHARDAQVVFTSGGSEANNLAIKGMAYALRRKGNHIIISSVEHPAITAPVRFLEKNGYEVSVASVDENGIVDPEAVANLIKPNTILVSIMLANNEVGSVQPVAQIGAVARANGVLMHTDAAQAVGKIPVDMTELGVDMISMAGHKFYAPKGVGALILKKGLKPEPLIHGAGHENGLRAGTENTAYLVGLGEAAALASERLPEYQKKVAKLRDRLHELILKGYPGAVLNGHPEKRLPNTLNISFPGIDAAKLMSSIQDRVACSTGSACHSGTAKPSEVLVNMGRSHELATSALRLSLGFQTTEAEITEAAAYILSKINKSK
jgi:cysteine desulfurase